MVLQGMEGFGLDMARFEPAISSIESNPPSPLAQDTPGVSVDERGRTLLHMAAAVGDAHACRSLLNAGFQPHQPDHQGRSASDHARSAGHFELAAALEGRLEAAGDVAARAPLDLRELMGLVGDNTQVAQQIIDGKRLHARDAKGDTPLHIVAMRGKMQVADLLVRAGADLHASNGAGLTPAQAAAANGHPLMASLLQAAAGDELAETPASGIQMVVEAEGAAPAISISPDMNLDELDGLDFEGEVEAEEFHSLSGRVAAQGSFLRVSDDIRLRTGDDDGAVDWTPSTTRSDISGDGLDDPVSPEATEDETSDLFSYRAPRKSAPPSAWRHFRIDEAGCLPVADRIVSAGHFSDDDLDEILGQCHGRFDAIDLRLNIQRELEAAGFPLIDAAEALGWDAATTVIAEELVEALVATCSRAAVLPGAAGQVVRQKPMLRLIETMADARRKMLLRLAESPAAIGIILYMADRVLEGEVEAAAMTAREFNPAHLSDEGTEFSEAVDVLRHLRDDVAAGSRRAVRRAADAAEALELRQEFLRDVADAMAEAPELVTLAADLQRNLDALEATAQAVAIAALPLCRRYAAQNAGEDDDQEDVFQVAFLGLQRGVLRFKPEVSTNFVAYASFWLRQSVVRWRADEGRLVRVPVHRQSMEAECRKVAEILERRLQRPPVPEEVAAELRQRPEIVTQIARIPAFPVELDVLEETDVPDDVHGIPESVLQDDIATLIHEELYQLDERQADVICRRFGIGFDDEMTLEEVGQIYGVTRERIRQIEAKAFQRLMHPGRMRYLSRAL